MVQPMVLVMETAVVTQPLQRVTEVLVVQTVDVSNLTIADAKAEAAIDRGPAPTNSEANAPLHTAST